MSISTKVATGAFYLSSLVFCYNAGRDAYAHLQYVYFSGIKPDLGKKQEATDDCFEYTKNTAKSAFLFFPITFYPISKNKKDMEIKKQINNK